MTAISSSHRDTLPSVAARSVMACCTAAALSTVRSPTCCSAHAVDSRHDDPQTAATLGYRPPLTDQAALALVCAHLDGAEIAERADELGLRALATDRRSGTPLFETEEIHDA
ncbi:hypothetical protein ACFV1U_32460 [Streptomyces microflavus]|uniref:hypothetical protein n=1 Tax=Streptomyces microflavus TaxID=1919 RepID=UPI0036C95C7D